MSQSLHSKSSFAGIAATETLQVQTTFSNQAGVPSDQACAFEDKASPMLARLLRRMHAVESRHPQLLLLPEFQPANRKQLISLVSCALETVFGSPARKNDRLPVDPKLITAFHSVSVPSMTIQAYFLRLAEFINCSGECFILALVHINRVHASKPEIAIDSLTIHRLLLTSLMCSAKFFDDHVYNNAMWANVGGVAIKELNALEREFLSLLDYSMYVGTEEFVCAYNEIVHPLLHSKCSSGLKCFFNVKHYPMPMPLNSKSSSGNDGHCCPAFTMMDRERADSLERKRMDWQSSNAPSPSDSASPFLLGSLNPVWTFSSRVKSLIASSVALEPLAPVPVVTDTSVTGPFGPWPSMPLPVVVPPQSAFLSPATTSGPLPLHSFSSSVFSTGTFGSSSVSSTVAATLSSSIPSFGDHPGYRSVSTFGSAVSGTDSDFSVHTVSNATLVSATSTASGTLFHCGREVESGTHAPFAGTAQESKQHSGLATAHSAVPAQINATAQPMSGTVASLAQGIGPTQMDVCKATEYRMGPLHPNSTPNKRRTMPDFSKPIAISSLLMMRSL